MCCCRAEQYSRQAYGNASFARKRYCDDLPLKNKNLPDVTRRADILVSAVGKANFITADMVKPGAVVIDVGMNRTPEGKLTGDVDFSAVEPIASFITPVPGGVGPMTVTMLLKNTVTAAKKAT